MPTRATESPGLAASIAPGDSAYALEAPPELVDARPTPPIAMPRDGSARTEQVSPAPRDAVPASPSVVQITQVIAPPPPSAPRDAIPIAAESAETPEALRVMPPVQRVESVVVAEQSKAPAPQSPRQTETSVEPLLNTPLIAEATRSIVATPPLDNPRASNAPRVELEIVRPSASRIAPLEVASPAARAPELPEVPLAPTRAATLELPRIAPPTPSSAPPAPPIHVRIGTVEVRPAAPAPARAAPKNASAPPALGFAAYRRLRTYRM